ncbi:MAG: PAS domain S-box protein [Desulfobacterales bacterium]|nr:PAS domain S-box protein [Desulfobacterales bacterium]
MKTSKPTMKVAITAIAAVAILISIIYVAYLSNKNFERTVVLQTEKELLTISKAIATNLEEFFIDYSNALVIVSNTPSLQKEAHERQKCYDTTCEFCPITSLYEAYKNKVYTITLLDANGIILRGEPFVKDRIGRDHSDKPDVAYVIREHKPHVSEVFYNNLGNLALSISEPIFYKNEFAGIVKWMIETDTIAKRFVEPIKIGNNGFVWMFDNGNTVLSHPRKDFIGMTVLNVIRKKHKERGEVFDENRTQEHIIEKHDYLNKVKAEEEGCGIFINCLTEEPNIIAYKRVAAGNLIFNLIVTLPYSEIIGPINNHAREIFGIAGFFIILLGAGGIALLKSQKEKTKFETETRYLQQIANKAAALRDSEKKYRVLFNSANDSIFVHQPTSEGLVNKFIEVNDVACKIYGYTKEEFLKLSPLDLTPHEDQADISPRMKKLFADKDIIYEKVQVSKDGKKIPVEISSHVFNFNNQQTVLSVVRDISERKQAEKRIRLLSQQLIKAQESERQMISCELHDSVAQSLSALKIGFDSIVYNHKELPDKIRQMFLEYSKTLQDSIVAVRDLAYDLRPPGLDQFGIIQTIFQYCEDFSEKTGLSVDFSSAGSEKTGLSVDFSSAGMENIELSSDMKINLYRLVQEGLINIKKHAEARHVIIRLAAAFPNIILRIKDDGKGFDVKSRLISAQDEKRMGLRSMEERVGLLGGKMDIKSNPAEGTNIFIKFPYKDIIDG